MLIRCHIFRLNIRTPGFGNGFTKNSAARTSHIMNQIRLIKFQTKMRKGIHLHPAMDRLAVNDYPIHIENYCFNVFQKP